MSSTIPLALISAAASAGTAGVFSNRPGACLSILLSSSSVGAVSLTGRRRRIRCEVALKSPGSEASTSQSSVAIDEYSSRIGAKVRVKASLKVHHIPRVPEVDLLGLEGVLKQYVAIWKGKRVSANLPFKIEFVKDIEGRGPVKFFAHLKEDEFDFI